MPMLMIVSSVRRITDEMNTDPRRAIEEEEEEEKKVEEEEEEAA